MTDGAFWTDSLGMSHEFGAYDFHGKWNPVSGVYIFAQPLYLQRIWRLLYVGQCEKFSNRVPGHEKWPSAVAMGATIVLACPISLSLQRDRVETELIQAFRPPLNLQHNLRNLLRYRRYGA